MIDTVEKPDADYYLVTVVQKKTASTITLSGYDLLRVLDLFDAERAEGRIR
jgi:hypothetical protein